MPDETSEPKQTVKPEAQSTVPSSSVAPHIETVVSNGVVQPINVVEEPKAEPVKVTQSVPISVSAEAPSMVPISNEASSTTALEAQPVAPAAPTAQSIFPLTSNASASNSPTAPRAMSDVLPRTPINNAAPVVGATIASGANSSIPTEGSSTSSGKKVSKKLIIGIVVAGVLALTLGGGSFAAYTWYQNPQKVLTDSLMSALTAKTSIYTGTLNIESDSVKAVLDITAKQSTNSVGSLAAKLTVTASGQKYVVSGAAQNDKDGNIYFKFDDLAEIAKSYLNATSEASNTAKAIDAFIEKIEGKWIKISVDDVKGYSSEASTAQACISDAMEKFKSDKAMSSEVVNIYNQNQFIVIDEEKPSQNGNFVYTLKGDTKKAKTFIQGLQGTQIYKKLHECDGNITIDANDISDTELDNNGTITVWINNWSHELSKIEIASKNTGTESSKFSLTLEPKFNQDITIATPTDTISLKELQTYIQEVSDAYTTDSEARFREQIMSSDLSDEDKAQFLQTQSQN